MVVSKTITWKTERCLFRLITDEELAVLREPLVIDFSERDDDVEEGE